MDIGFSNSGGRAIMTFMDSAPFAPQAYPHLRSPGPGSNQLMIFQDRKQAGEKLAQELTTLSLQDPIVLALPRGGVPVGRPVAQALACAFDVVPLVKMPVPWSPEASYGVVAMDGTMALNKPLVNRLELSERELEMAAAQVLGEAKRRDQLYRQGRPFPELSGKTAILIDDCLVSGYSMLAAFMFVKKRAPRGVIVAAPIASDMARRILAAEKGIDRIVTLAVDVEQVFSMASYYRESHPLTDDDVMRQLGSP